MCGICVMSMLCTYYMCCMHCVAFLYLHGTSGMGRVVYVMCVIG